MKHLSKKSKTVKCFSEHSFGLFLTIRIEKSVKSECDIAEIWKSGNILDVFFVYLQRVFEQMTQDIGSYITESPPRR